MRSWVVLVAVVSVGCKPTYGKIYEKYGPELARAVAIERDVLAKVRAAPRPEVDDECDQEGLKAAFAGKGGQPGNTEFVDFQVLALRHDEALHEERLRLKGERRCVGHDLDPGPLGEAANVGVRAARNDSPEMPVYTGLEDDLARAKDTTTLIVLKSDAGWVECATAIEVFVFDVASSSLRCSFLADGTATGVEDGYWVTVNKRTGKVVNVTSDRTVERSKNADARARVRLDLKERFGLSTLRTP